MTQRDIHPAAIAASAFAAGLVAGLYLKNSDFGERARGWWAHRGRTLVYDENMPAQLERREPEPSAGQPRFGGTGAMGVHPAAAGAVPSRDR